VEVVIPIRDERIKRYLKEEVLETYLRDNMKARILKEDGTYERIQPAEGEEAFDSQSYFAGRVSAAS
jgi:polyphosphate kinase